MKYSQEWSGGMTLKGMAKYLITIIVLCLVPSVQTFASDSVVIYEVDNSTQTNRPSTIGRVFAQGEIDAGNTGKCPQPLIGGVAVSAGNWQADVKNRWPDGSVKFAIVSFWGTISAGSSITVTFQAGTCNTSGLTATQMANFSDGSGSWGAGMVVTPGAASASAAAVTTDIKAMLAHTDPASNSFNDCKNDYWLKGPVVTAVIVQDCTTATTYDFGWAWNGTNMASDGVNPSYTGNNVKATFHPMAVVYFYGAQATPTTVGAVKVDFILEMPWYLRAQDQLADLKFTTGSTPSTKWQTVGARRFADTATTVGNATITSATGAFATTDVGLPIAICGATNGCTGNASIDTWYVLATRTNATTAALYRTFCPDTGCPTTNNITYINLHAQGSRFRKTFWSGTAPGTIRADYNFAYLVSTHAFPYYDLTGAAYADPTTRSQGSSGVTAWTDWVSGNTSEGISGFKNEIGDITGVDALEGDFAENSEGAPLQREDLLYLYNMNASTSHDGSNAGTAGGLASKAWQMLTGEASTHDAISCTLTVNGSSVNCPTAGGLGVWYGSGHIPFHMRDNRTAGTGAQTTSNYFYVPKFDLKDAALSDTCNDLTTCKGGVTYSNMVDAFGRIGSRHTHSDLNWGPGNWPSATGTYSNNQGGWSIGGCNHWQDWWYTPYLLTGDYYYYDEIQMAASYCIQSQNPDPQAAYGGAKFFGFDNTQLNTPRELAWGIQAISRAAFTAVDGTPEADYQLSMLNSQIEIMEGATGITGTSVTPSDTSCSAATCSYNPNAANRWNWGRSSYMSQCITAGTNTCTTFNNPPPLHMIGPGSCTTDPTYLTLAVSNALIQNWQYNYLSMSLGITRDLGYSVVASLHNEMGKSMEERIGDSNYNAYLIGAYEDGTNNVVGGSTCAGTYPTTPPVTTYTMLKSAMVSTVQAVGSFLENSPPAGYINIACGDHGYSAIGRAAATFLQKYSINSTDANCPGGSCTAANTKLWLQAEHPYYGTTLHKCTVSGSTYSCAGAAVSNTCNSPSTWFDTQVKYALDFQPVGVASPGSIQTQNTIRKAGTVMQ